MEYEAIVGRLSKRDDALAARIRESFPTLPELLRALPRELRAVGVSEDISALPAVLAAVTRRERIDTLRSLRVTSRGEANALCAWLLTPGKLPASVLIPLDAKGKMQPPRSLSRGRKYTMYELLDVILEEMRDAGAKRFIVGLRYDAELPANKMAYAADADRLYRAIRPFGIELYDYVITDGTDAFSVMRWVLGE